MTATETGNQLERETPMCDGVTWFTTGPRGRVWVIVWQGDRTADNIRAWPFPGGRTAHFGHATDLESAREQARQIAQKIRTGKR